MAQPPQPPSGPPGYPPQFYPQAPVQQSNGLGIAAGVVGIVSLVVAFIPFVDFVSVPGGIVAVVLGVVGVNRANQMGGQGRGMAITGIVTGAVAIALVIVFVGLVYSYFATHNLNDIVIPSFTPFPT